MDKVSLQIIRRTSLNDSATSIIPCLALKGVATAVAGSHTLKAKVLLCTFTETYSKYFIYDRPDLHDFTSLVNSRNDRETHGYSAVDYITFVLHLSQRIAHTVH